MDKTFLLTFKWEGDGHLDFNWFDDEEELRKFVDEKKDSIRIFDAIELLGQREINI